MHKALLQETKLGPLVWRDVQTPSPGEGEILIRVEAATVQTGDHKLLETGLFISQWPYIGGSEVAGVVQEIGPGVNNLQVNDRVFGHTTAVLPFLGARAGAWQQYSILKADFLAKIPDMVSFEEAITVPVGFLTALDAILKLNLKWPGDSKHVGSEEPILVWGGSSCVGRNAIWLLKQAGYNNISATASKSRTEMVHNLGAAHVFDYNDEDIVSNILEAFHGSRFSKVLDAISLPESVAFTSKLVQDDGYVAETFPGIFNNLLPATVNLLSVSCTIFQLDQRQFAVEKVWPWIQKALEARKYPFQPYEVIGGRFIEAVEQANQIFKSGRVGGKKWIVKPNA
ncbi:chaperonin 10-like protein [Xylogone sp. PMI_703]|nr:chaperonin 10-like protein [Xylogone sp. PMI_703]